MRRAAGVLGATEVAAERPWTLLSTEWTLTFPPGESPDIAIVQRIRREFFTEYVPLWCRKVYKDPAGHPVITGWHVVGEWAPLHDDPMRPPIKVDLPLAPTPLFPFRGGVIYDVLGICDVWSPGSRGARLCAPPDYVPYDARVFNYLQAADRFANREFGKLTEKVRVKLDLRADKERRGLEHVEEEARLSLHDDRFMIRRAIQEGHLTDPPKEPQPYVQAEKVFEEGAP